MITTIKLTDENEGKHEVEMFDLDISSREFVRGTAVWINLNERKSSANMTVQMSIEDAKILSSALLLAIAKGDKTNDK